MPSRAGERLARGARPQRHRRGPRRRCTLAFHARSDQRDAADQSPRENRHQGRQDDQRPPVERRHLFAADHRRSRASAVADEKRSARVHGGQDLADAVVQRQADPAGDRRRGELSRFAERCDLMRFATPSVRRAGPFGPAVMLALAAVTLSAQVSSDRLTKAAGEPQNWLTYSGSYMSQRHSALKQITPANVKNLELKWVFQAQSLQTFEATPLVVDGIMYLTQAPNDAVALDAKTGRVFWMYHYVLPQSLAVCCGQVNRGLAILGDTLFMGTLDAHIVAIDAKSGRPIWKTKVAENAQAYALPVSPLVVKDK